jgi:hypothetical protein
VLYCFATNQTTAALHAHLLVASACCGCCCQCLLYLTITLTQLRLKLKHTLLRKHNTTQQKEETIKSSAASGWNVQQAVMDAAKMLAYSAARDAPLTTTLTQVADVSTNVHEDHAAAEHPWRAHALGGTSKGDGPAQA